MAFFFLGGHQTYYVQIGFPTSCAETIGENVSHPLKKIGENFPRLPPIFPDNRGNKKACTTLWVRGLKSLKFAPGIN